MPLRARIIDWLILLLGLAIVFDTSVQLNRDSGSEWVWEPITESPASSLECCDPASFDGLPPVFTA